MLLALFMHLIPAMVLTAAIIAAWRWEWVGTVLFIGWGILYVTRAHGPEWFVYVLVAGLPALIGCLFLAGWIWRKQIREV
jgi:hypothetical protein